MSEEPKNIRLNKAAKELNVGIPTMVEYLAKKGHTIDANPNARLTPEQYALLATAFKADSQVKENADRIEINTGNTVVIEATGANETGESIRSWQSGDVRKYAIWFISGAVALTLVLLAL